jgi:hypothetical protein
MNSALRHVLSFEVELRRAIDGPRCDNQIGRSHNAAHLRDQYPASFGEVEHSDITVTSAFGRDVADEVFRQPVKFGFRHSKSPLRFNCAESNTQLTSNELKSAFCSKIRSATSQIVHIADLDGALA